MGPGPRGIIQRSRIHRDKELGTQGVVGSTCGILQKDSYAWHDRTLSENMEGEPKGFCSALQVLKYLVPEKYE